jgi:predicted SnoaL-like aldol condensation-catalyzing enzyme
MPTSKYPVGLVFDVTYPMFKVTLTLLSESGLKFHIASGPHARTEEVAIEVVDLSDNRFAVSWQEKDKATVVNIQDFDALEVHSYATLPDGTLLRNKGAMTIRDKAGAISDHSPRRNRALVLEAMTSLFQRHDGSVIDRLYTKNYVQHNPSIPPGSEALKQIVAGMEKSVFYEPGLMVAQGDLVAIHGRIKGWGPQPQVVVDLFRVEGGKLAEHWDVLQVEVPSTSAAMFDPAEGKSSAT